jgi:hypothetical protein
MQAPDHSWNTFINMDYRASSGGDACVPVSSWCSHSDTTGSFILIYQMDANNSAMMQPAGGSDG